MAAVVKKLTFSDKVSVNGGSPSTPTRVGIGGIALVNGDTSGVFSGGFRSSKDSAALRKRVKVDRFVVYQCGTDFGGS